MTATILGECLALLLAWHVGLASVITSNTADDFDAALTATQSIPPSSRRTDRNRIAGLRRELIEARIADIYHGAGPWQKGPTVPIRSGGRRDSEDVVALCHRRSCRASSEISSNH